MTRIHIPESWRRTAEAVLEQERRTVLVLGASDRGKSTYCRFLVSALAGAGHRVALVDACIGQKEIGPPATVTLSHADGATDMRASAADAFYFVGSTSPVGRLLPLVIGTAHLARTADAPYVVVDTTGYIEGTGRVLKGYKIEAVRPDLIIAIERKGELDAILNAYRTYHTIRLRPSRHARPKDYWQRDRVRRRAFAMYFKDAQSHRIDLDQLAIQRSLLFTGTPVEVEGALYAERTAEGLVVISEGRPGGEDIVAIHRPGFERNLLCGVADDHNICHGLAILECIDFERRAISLLSPVAGDRIRVLQLGDLYIDRDGYELDRVSPEGL